MADYLFRPLVPADRARIVAWLAQPHIGGWWQDGDTEWPLLAAEFGTGRCDMRVVETGGVPFAFVQDYDVRTWPMPQYDDLPEGARAMDTFLGNPAYIGRGHGAGYIRARADALLAQFPLVAVDPSPENTRAIRAYTAAGFVPRCTTPCEDGDPVTVMTRLH
ncbi:GNAT family N-acetyltransferase [Celeribacter arenosi]|uniref:GNAT family N-acetyltransferase n=1 Tax=Celeribacter arenosi TaxID=792649 RepID=A0ABP7K3D0_9RHOB